MKKVLFFAFLICFFAPGKAQVINPAFCQTNGAVNAVVIDSVNNVIYIGGSFSQVCGSPRNRLAAMDLSTGALLPWNPGANNVVNVMHVYNNALYVGGYFTTIGGQGRNYAAKFSLPSGSITSWNPAITTGSAVETIASYSNKIYLGGNFLLTISTGNNLCELDTANAAATPWNDFPNGVVHSISIEGNSLYVGGGFTQVGATPVNYLAKYYLSPGSSATLSTWLPNPDLDVYALLAKSGRVFVSGTFSYFNGVDNRERIAEVDSSTGLVTAWNPGADGPAMDLQYRNGMIYAVGNFGIIGGKSRNFVAAINATTGLVSNWNVLSTVSTWKSATTNNEIFLGGAFNTLLGQPRNNFAAICINPIDTISVAPDGPTNVCAGVPSISYSVAPVPGATSYVWSYNGSGVVINGTGSTVSLDFSTATAPGGDLTVYATNGCETSNTMTLSVSVYNFIASVSGNASMVCGDSTVLTGSDNYGGNGTLTYKWTPATALSYTNTTVTTSGSQTTIAYTYDVLSSEGCKSGAIYTLTVNPITVNLSAALGGTILCSTSDTIIAVNDYPGAGTVTYTWSPTTGLNLSNPSKPVASPVTTTNYTVNAMSSDGCAALAQSIGIFVSGITVTPSANPATITCGNTTTLTATNDYPGTGSVTYTWSPAADLSNANSASPVANPTVTTNFLLNIITPEGCMANSSIFVTVNDLALTTNPALNTNCGTSVNLSASDNSGNPNLVYSWGPASSLNNSAIFNPVANPSSTTIYTVTLSLPSSGCFPATAYDTVNILPPATPNICEVSTNDSSTNNVIYWDKTMYQPSDSFIVYRETTTNTYSQIAIIAHTDSSFYMDTARSIGPANGDPNIGTYRYKIAVKDSCGYISQKSPYHNSVYFIDNQTGVFTWNLYAVEGQITPVTQFDLMRDNANNGIWILVGSVTGTQTTLNDPNYSTYQSIANWRVEAQGFNCTPTAKQANGIQGAVVKSKSNITNNRVIGIKNNILNNIGVYPNPNNGKFMVDLIGLGGNISIKIFNILGEEVYSGQTTASGSMDIDLSNQQNGTYVIQVSNEKHLVTKRIIKN